MAGLADLSLVEAAEAVRGGDATSAQLLAACWANLEHANPSLNATIWLDHDGAAAAAQAADEAVRAKRPLGKMHGVPMAHKDMYYQAGRPCTCGSRIRADFRPGYTATVIERLQAACAYVWGGLNMAEFRPGITASSAIATIRGACRTSPVDHRLVPARLWRLGSISRRWAPTRADR